VDEPGLISVRTQVVLDTLVGSMADAVAERAGQPLEAPVEAALAAIGDERRKGLARAGYLTRALEVERFERARAPMPWLSERMGHDRTGGGDWSAAAAALATELATAEPGRRPEPDDEQAVSWRVPGPGGHVRHYLAVRAADELRDGGPSADAKRAWLAGFLIHCIQEAVPPVRSSEPA
jgi:hypothetical protein